MFLIFPLKCLVFHYIGVPKCNVQLKIVKEKLETAKKALLFIFSYVVMRHEGFRF